MNATLSFSLPDDEFEYHSAINGSAYRIILKGVLEQIRERLKYGTQLTEKDLGELSGTAREELEALRTSIYEDLRDIGEEV